jgi:uncharacterized repeat protein (TIGR03803 family)
MVCKLVIRSTHLAHRASRSKFRLLILSALTLTGCGGGQGLTTSSLQTIQISPVSSTLGAMGIRQQFVATGMYENHTTQDLTADVTWASSNFETATISNDGGAAGLAISGAPGTTLISATMGTVSSPGVTLKVIARSEVALHSFVASSDGAFPTALILGHDGNLYGTTSFGGANDSGILFEVMPSDVETVLYSFMSGADGDPGLLVQGADGNFYGNSTGSTAGYAGTLFKLTPDGVHTVLYRFRAGNDGTSPSALIFGSDGSVYGTTSQGGASGNGKVLKVTQAGIQTILYSFMGGADGAFPSAMIQGSDGNFYGTTSGGGNGYGTIFKVTLAGVETVLYSFTGGADGKTPHLLIQGTDANFYGAANSSGNETSNGTVFKLTTDGVYTALYTFTGGADGTDLRSLIQGIDGNLYGINLFGGDANGQNGHGTIFEVIPPTGMEATLYTFTDGADGAYPSALIQGRDGYLYGSAQAGGGGGTVFRF